VAIIGTFNGWNQISIPPAYPGPQSVEWNVVDAVASTTNPFTQSQQILDWGASLLEATITMPPLTDEQARAWAAFFMQTHGQANVFAFGDPLATFPLGTPSGTPVVNGGTQSGYTLASRGWMASTSDLLLAGDWIQLGPRLYRNLDDVTSDGSGNATLNIWPQIRETPAVLNHRNESVRVHLHNP
jgi:hypothetical protein